MHARVGYVFSKAIPTFYFCIITFLKVLSAHLMFPGKWYVSDVTNGKRLRPRHGNSNIVIMTNRPHLGPPLRSAFNGRLSIWKRFMDKYRLEIEVNRDNSLSDGPYLEVSFT